MTTPASKPSATRASSCRTRQQWPSPCPGTVWLHPFATRGCLRSPAMSTPQIPDIVTVDVKPGTTVLITSDLHFAAERTEASAWAEVEVSKRLESLEGPAVLILAGDVFELWA